MNKAADIEKAIGSHALWMSHLRQAILEAHSTIDVEKVRAEDECEFGKWLYGPRLSAEDRASSYYGEVKHLHAEFHRLAARVVEMASSGRTRDAYDLLYGEYMTMSGQLAIAMRAWQDKLRARG